MEPLLNKVDRITVLIQRWTVLTQIRQMEETQALIQIQKVEKSMQNGT